jgi:glycosyltransferase involved in cell wall biosynthesis
MKIDEQISLIIPAYNEAKHIGRVLDQVLTCSFIDEVIVVNDGSTDGTKELVSRYSGVKLVNQRNNLGKGAAIVAGIKAAKFDVLLFLDADLVSLKTKHLLELLAPIVYFKRAKMTLGVFGLKEINSTNLASRMFPSITGQRAMRRDALPSLEKILTSRYGVDLLLTKSVAKKDQEIVKLDGLSQVVKEKKVNKPIKAVKQRIKMYSEIAATSRSIKRNEDQKL